MSSEMKVRILQLLAGAAAGIVLLWRHPPNTQFPRYYLVQDYITKNSRDNEPITTDLEANGFTINGGTFILNGETVTIS